MTTPTLTEILTDLIINSNSLRRVTLSRGLILAYTPRHVNTTNPDTYRLTLSRRGQYPSEQEIEVVKRELRDVLHKNGRVPDRFYLEPYLRANGNIHYHVLFWRELVQAKLI